MLNQTAVYREEVLFLKFKFGSIVEHHVNE